MAGQLDADAKSNGQIPRRAMIATLLFAGLRIGELVALDWKDVDLANGRLRVEDAKTDAGVRWVTLLPAPRDELAALKARVNPKSGDPVFPTQKGGRTRPDNFRPRVLARAVAQANENLEAQGTVPLPKLTPHKLQHTFCSVLYALGEDPGTVMDELGHSDESVALRIYRHPMRRDEAAKAKLRALVNGEPVEATVTDSASGVHAVVDV